MLRSSVLFLSLLNHVHAEISTQFTCAPGSPEASLPFCNRTLGFQARSVDLVSRLNLSEKLDLWGHSYPSSTPVERFNVKSWSLDHTCIHGLNKETGVTVFAHAIALGASFDPDLVYRVGNATAIEARILSWKKYTSSNGASQASVLSCDGGPHANSAHDPRWGRISETYGEDPYLLQEIGVAAIRSMQNQQEVPHSPGDHFMAMRLTTCNFLGYHSARPDLGPFHAIMNVTNRSLADSYLPIYAAYQKPSVGNADGMMCAMTSVNGVPSCGNPYLLTTLLREVWESDALVQTDCCDAIRTMNDPFHYNGITTDSEALQLGVETGVQVYYGFSANSLLPAFEVLLSNGSLQMAQLDSAAARIVKSQMKLGLFDSHSDDFPFTNASTPWDLLDSPQHRALARESASSTTVLLKNKNAILPLTASTTSVTAVIGPFANCTECLLQSYNGLPSKYSTFYEGISNRTNSVYSLGSNTTCGIIDSECWNNVTSPEYVAIQASVAVAAKSDLVVLVVGLGNLVESEGLDRLNMTLPGVQMALLEAVQAVAKKLVVICVSGGGVDLDEDAADAVIYSPYGGEEAGSGVADVLFGDVNPSAKLPLTFYTQGWSDFMNVNYSTSIAHFDLNLGYGRTHRYVDPNYVKHGFGFGLSYTSFAYSNLTVEGAASPYAAKVVVTVTNTGSRAGADVVQVYTSVPQVQGVVVPKHNFVAFQKVFLSVGQSRTVVLEVRSDPMKVAMDDGTRVFVSPSQYTFVVGGNQEGETGTSGAVQKTVVEL